MSTTALVLRFDAVTMAFGGVMVDERNPTEAFPYRAMLAGLLANALGWDHSDADKIEALQGALRYAARRDRAGQRMEDFHTVDMAQSPERYPEAQRHMQEDRAWTTWGHTDGRGGANSSTHIRYRDYLMDCVVTVVLRVETGAGVTQEEVARALASPERPLFIGRKCNIPSEPIARGNIEAETLREAIATVPRSRRADEGRLLALWPLGDGGEEHGRVVPRVEDRDWVNQYHQGRRFYVEGLMDPPEAS